MEPDPPPDMEDYRRRLQEFRAFFSEERTRERNEVFRMIEQVLGRVYRHPRLMADREISLIFRRMMGADDLEELNYELRRLAERLGEIAGMRVVTSGPEKYILRQGSPSTQIPGELENRPPGRRLRLKL